MDAVQVAREAKKKELLCQLAELLVEEQVEQGVFLKPPHYSVIEQQAIKLGQELSRQAQQRSTREVAAICPTQVAWPAPRAKRLARWRR